MSRSTYADLVERALDAAAADPRRVGDLKRLLRKRSMAHDGLSAPRPMDRRAVAAQDAGDDSLWDNVPV
jgi:hypothetical protein